MSEPTTKSPAMSEADIERIIAAIGKRGANVNIQDPRVSQVQTWLIGLVGMGAIVAMGWMANSIDSLNRTMERNNAQLEYLDRRLSSLEARKP